MTSSPTGTSGRRRLPLRPLMALLVAGAVGVLGWTLAAPGDTGAGGTTGGTTGGTATAEAADIPTPGPPTTATAGAAALVVDLPVPEDAPADPHADTPYVLHGTLSLPTIGVTQPLHEGATLTAIDQGPSHWPGTAMPGQLGNVVIAGHRTTYTKPFYDLDLLQPGDPLVFTMNDGTVWTYELTSTELVGPDDMRIVDQTPGHTATLFACHPKGSAAQRIVGHFRLVDPPAT